MTNIDFFGCSFTQNTNSKFRATRPISMQEYVRHTHITKVQSNFLEFDFEAAFMKACFGLLGFFLLEEAIRV